MTEKTILIIVFAVLATLTINVFHVCHTWRIVTLMNKLGIEEEGESGGEDRAN